MSKQSTTEKPIRSPCVSICVLDEQDICTGCYRSAAEIHSWRQMTDEQKRETIQLALKRRRKENPFQ